ncbi:MAG TPA: hypothetical protein VKM96_04995 [Candidatus Bathyarchaeia archaeon]|nr:hypothetical protein [Candidatus Bathyarchaeia archaeon]
MDIIHEGLVPHFARRLVNLLESRVFGHDLEDLLARIPFVPAREVRQSY